MIEELRHKTKEIPTVGRCGKFLTFLLGIGAKTVIFDGRSKSLAFKLTLPNGGYT